MQTTYDASRTMQLVGHSPARLDLSQSDFKRWSLAKAIECAAQNKQLTGGSFEADCHKAIATRLGDYGQQHRIYVPAEILAAPIHSRDLTVASPTGGGYLVATENMSFIELMRYRSVVRRLGATTLPGLVGNAAVPKQTAGATAYWLASEATAITESAQTFGQVALTPKTVGAYTEISRQLNLQANPAVEGVVMRDLAATLAIASDQAVLNGSGAGGQPSGILNTSGIGTVTGGSLAYADALEFQEDVFGTGLDLDYSTAGYVTTTAVASLLLQRDAFSSQSTLWVGNVADGMVGGFRAMSSAQMPAGYMIFGIWSDVLIGEWSVLQLEVDPFAGFKAGIVGVRGIYSMDVAVRRAASFAYASSIT